MQMRVTQVTFMADTAVIAGEPLNDPTKVVVAAAEPLAALELAMAVAAGVPAVVDPPDEAIIEVLEKPKG